MPADLITVEVVQDFVHPSGIAYKAGKTVKLTALGAQIWLAEGWIKAPDLPVAPATTPPAAA